MLSTTEGPREATYTYDDNGNMTTGEFTNGANRRVQWTSFNKPRAIVRASNPPADGFYTGGALSYSNASAFYYAPDRSRYKQIRNRNNKDGQDNTTIVYIGGGLYERLDSGNGDIEHRAYIQANGKTIAIEIDDGTTNATHYLHRDHLGSVTAVTDANGDLVKRMAYDAFGKRREIDWQPDNASDDLLYYNSDYPTDRGFTRHEQMDNVGLINMNGRTYDPIIGRFISPDPFIQFPDTTQGFNRYTYVNNNNPLSYTDPSGHFVGALFYAGVILFATGEATGQDQLRAFGVSVAVAGVGAGLDPAQAAGVGFGAGFAASGGNVKAGVYSAATAAAFSGAGGYLKGAAPLEGASTSAQAAFYVKGIVLHGAIGGLSSDVQGGSFSSGFFAAAGAKAFAPALDENGALGIQSDQGRIFAAAIIGGTASELSGGKFANGAVTGAFSRAFNDEGAESQTQREFKSLDEIDYISLGGNTLSFGFSTGEAVFGAFLMTNPASLLFGTGVASHGLFGMANDAIGIRNDLHITQRPSIGEALGGAIGGETGANTGRIIDGVISASGGVRAIGRFSNSSSFINAINDASDVNQAIRVFDDRNER